MKAQGEIMILTWENWHWFPAWFGLGLMSLQGLLILCSVGPSIPVALTGSNFLELAE